MIYPGAVIEFFPGNFAKAPNLQVNTPGDKMESPASQPSEEMVGSVEEVANPEEALKAKIEERPISAESENAGLFADAPPLPPPSFKSQPVGGFPPSFKSTSQTPSKYGEGGIHLDLRPQMPSAGQLIPQSYLYQGRFSSLASLGEVVELENGERSTGVGGFVYIDSQNELTVGQKMTVVSKGYQLKSLGKGGTSVRYAGVVQITESLASSRYRAEVIGALFPIGKGAKLVRQEIPSLSSSPGRENARRVEIFAGEYDNNRKVFGSSSLVYLSGGRDQGIQVGDTFGVYKNRSSRYKDAKVSESPRPVAMLKVYDVQDSVASGILINAVEDVRIKDFTGPLATGNFEISGSERSDIDAIENQLDSSEESFAEEGEGNLDDEDFDELESEEGSSEESDLEDDAELDAENEDFDALEEDLDGL